MNFGRRVFVHAAVRYVEHCCVMDRRWTAASMRKKLPRSPGGFQRLNVIRDIRSVVTIALTIFIAPRSAGERRPRGDPGEIEQWIIINQMGAKPRTGLIDRRAKTSRFS